MSAANREELVLVRFAYEVASEIVDLLGRLRGAYKTL